MRPISTAHMTCANCGQLITGPSHVCVYGLRVLGGGDPPRPDHPTVLLGLGGHVPASEADRIADLETAVADLIDKHNALVHAYDSLAAWVYRPWWQRAWAWVKGTPYV